MKKTLSVLIALCIMLLNSYTVNSAEGEIRFYVSPNGDDNAAGSFDAPLKSINGAKAKILELKSSNQNTPITVYLRGGEYRFVEQVSFDSPIFHEGDAKVSFLAYNDEKPIFTNRITIDSNLFHDITDEHALSRIFDEDLKASIKCLNLDDIGITKLPKFDAWVSGMMNKPSYPTLYLDDEEQLLSQWPNFDYDTTGRMLNGGKESGYAPRGGIGYDTIIDGAGFTFQYNSTQPNKWSNANDFFIEGYLRYDYFFGAYNVEELDTINGTITTKQGANGGAALEDRRWRARNLLEEVDMIGEYYIDYSNNRIYYYAPDCFSVSKLSLVCNTNQFIKLDGASNFTFCGITFDGTLSTAVQVYNCSNIAFDNCAFKNIGMRGIEAYNCKGLSVTNSAFSVIGGSAIWLRGGDRVNLVSSYNVIDNCTFYKWAQRQRSYEPGIHLHDVGARITNNEFHNAPFSAILFTGNDNYIYHNEVYNVLDGINDGGAIYMALGPAFRGNEVCYNYVHDLFEGINGDKSQLVGIYFDDGTSGSKIHHNIVLSAKTGIASSGRDNEIYNNIIDADNSAITIDNRGETWQKGQYYNEDGTIAKKSRAMSNYYAYKKYKAYNKYPHFSNLDTDPISMNLTAYNSVYNNVAVNGKYNLCDTAIKYASKLENNLTLPKSAFVDFDGGIYALTDNSVNIEPLNKNEYVREVQPHCINGIEVYDSESYAYSEGVDPNNAVFVLNPSLNTDRYLVKLYLNDNEVSSYYTTNNCFSLTDLIPSTEYSMEVVAENIGATDLNDYCTDFSFTTSDKTNYHKQELNSLIQKVSTNIASINAGEGVGEEPNYKLDGFSALLNNINCDTLLSKQSVDDTIALVKDLDVQTQNLTNWGYTHIQTGEANNGFSYVQPQFANEVKCFGINAAFHERPLQIVLRSNINEYGVDSQLFKGYVIDLTRSKFTLSKQVRGLKTPLTTIDNNLLNDNRLHQVRIGAVYIQDGIKITIFIDGKKLITYKDKDAPLFDIGYFGIKGFGTISESTEALDTLNDPSQSDDPLPYYVDMNELLSTKDNWRGSGEFSVENGVLKTKGECHVWTNDIIPQNGIVRFMGKMNLGTAWQGLAVRDSLPSALPWQCNDYLVCLKPKCVEIQSFNNQINLFLDVLDTEYDWSIYHEFEFASYDVDQGVQVILKIDGVELLNYIDQNPINNPGHFGIYDFSNQGFEIKAVE